MDRQQITELIAERMGAHWEVAARAVAELERRDLLVLGPPRRWKVTVDDPGATRAYSFDDIEAYSAEAASVKAARRVIEAEPHATLGTKVELSREQRSHMADYEGPDGLPALVARYAVAEERPVAAAADA